MTEERETIDRIGFMKKQKTIIYIFLILSCILCIYGDFFRRSEDRSDREIEDIFRYHKSKYRDPSYPEPKTKYGTQTLQIYYRSSIYSIPLGATLSIENPFPEKQQVILYNQYSYECDLGTFQPGEIRTYDESYLPYLQTLCENQYLSTFYLYFENGKKSTVSRNQTSIANAIDLCLHEPSQKDKAQANAELMTFYMPFVNPQDQKDCIESGFQRYYDTLAKKQRTIPPFSEKEKLQLFTESIGKLPGAKYHNDAFYTQKHTSYLNSFNHLHSRMNKQGFYSLGISDRYYSCPHCHQQTVFSSLYCIHCGKINLSHHLKLPQKQIYSCPYCSNTTEEMKCTRYNRSFTLEQSNAIYDGEKELFGCSITSSFYQDTQNKLWFDPRICLSAAHYTNQKMQLDYLERAQIEGGNWFQPTHRETIYCNHEIWNLLQIMQKEELKDYCIQGGILTIYHANQNKAIPIGTGLIIYCKNHYLHSQFCKEHLQTLPIKPQAEFNQKTLIVPHIQPTFIQTQQTTDYFKPFQTLYTKAIYPVLFCTLMIPGIIIFYRKKFKQKILLYFFGIEILCLAALGFFFIKTYHRPHCYLNRLSILDEAHTKLWSKTCSIYFRGGKARENFTLPPANLYNIKQYSLDFSKEHASDHSSYHQRTYSLGNYSQILMDYTSSRLQLKKESYYPGSALGIQSESVENTREKLLIDTKNRTIHNGYSKKINDLLVYKNKQYYQSESIISGAKELLKPLTEEEAKEAELMKKLEQYPYASNYVRYLLANEIEFSLCTLQEETFPFLEESKISSEHFHSYRITLLAPSKEDAL